MEEKEEIEYQVEITESARLYFYEIADYLYDNLSLSRAEEVTTSLHEKALSLNKLFYRGSKEKVLSDRPQGYKYLLFERSKSKYVKIIYYVDEAVNKVYVTDFFPSEMDDKKIRKRNR